MSTALRIVKMKSSNVVSGESAMGNIEVAEAIKALQTQLADLRKIVRAAKAPDGIAASGRRQ
jgi:hypothetical protein